MNFCHLRGMASHYTAIIQQNNGWWVGWIEEVPGVNAQEKTKEKLLCSLRETLKEAIEFNRQDAKASAQGGYTEELVSV
jgi:predicted RNase H-like HicB family nuclease